MPLPPEMLKWLERQTNKVRQRVLDNVESLGVRLTPCGTTTFSLILHGVWEHTAVHAKGKRVSMEFAVQCTDEFMATWVIQRLEEDPAWLDKVRKASLDEVERMFQKDVPDLKVTS